MSPVIVALGIYACADDASSDALTDTGATPSPTQPDATVEPHDSAPPTSVMRLAHLARGSEPIDFCWKTQGAGSFEGPILGGGVVIADAGDADAGTPSLSYRDVSRYVELASSGTLTIAIVPAGAPCGQSLVTGDVTLDPGKLSTVMFSGIAGSDAGDQLAVTSFVDDHGTDPQHASVRIIHAALGPNAVPIAVRASAGDTIDLAAVVEPRKAGSASTTVNALGYATIAPVPNPASIAVAPIAITDSGPTPGWQSTATTLDLHGNTVHTGFVLAGENAPYEVLWCADTSTLGELGACLLVK